MAIDDKPGAGPREIFRIWARTERKVWLLTLAVFFVMGLCVQLALPIINIAYFARPWQFATLYCGFLTPLSILLRGRPWYQQYAYSVVAIMPIEICAFILHTSVSYPNNYLEPIVGTQNFTLAMVLLDSWIPCVGTWIVAALAAQWLAEGRPRSGDRRSASIPPLLERGGERRL